MMHDTTNRTGTSPTTHGAPDTTRSSRRSTTLTTTRFLYDLRDAKNAAAWSALDARHRPIIEAFAMSLGLTADEALDVAQQTMTDFFTAYRDGAYDRGRGRLRAWILTIARNRAMDVHRRAAVRRCTRGESRLVEMPSDAACAAMWEKAERCAIARAAWDEMGRTSRMSEENLRAFELVEIRGLSVAAAGAACGMPADRVYKAISRAMAQYHEIVRRLAAEAGDEPPEMERAGDGPALGTRYAPGPPGRLASSEPPSGVSGRAA